MNLDSVMEEPNSQVSKSDPKRRYPDFSHPVYMKPQEILHRFRSKADFLSYFRDARKCCILNQIFLAV